MIIKFNTDILTKFTVIASKCFSLCHAQNILYAIYLKTINSILHV